MSKQKKHSEGSQEKKRKGGKKAIAICIVVVILLAILLFLLLNKEPARNVVVNEDNVEEVIENREFVPPGSYEVTMNYNWNFASGTAASDNAYVKNAESNKNPVYFDVIRKDTDETIYKSPILTVGSHLNNITLDSDLPTGVYDCIVTYHLLDEKDESFDTVSLNLTINIGQ
ncbi:MAG: hypothetical protein HFE75_03810 [Firmicutes bacterium]|nr:hypothetical protein [Bacillota bacterium]